MPARLIPRRPASRAALVLAAAALAFAATSLIGGMLRSAEPASPAAAAERVTLRVELPATDALPSLAPAPRPTASKSESTSTAPPPAGTRPPATTPPATTPPVTTPATVPPPAPAASTKPEEEVGHSATP